MASNRHGKQIDEVYAEIVQYIDDGGEYGWILGSGLKEPNPDWLNYAMVINDQAIPYVLPLMPKTMAMLGKIKGIKMCALLTMKGPSMIPIHAHQEIHEEKLLQFHITLDAPKNNKYAAYLNVNGEFSHN